MQVEQAPALQNGRETRAGGIDRLPLHVEREASMRNSGSGASTAADKCETRPELLENEPSPVRAAV